MNAGPAQFAPWNLHVKACLKVIWFPSTSSPTSKLFFISTLLYCLGYWRQSWCLEFPSRCLRSPHLIFWASIYYSLSAALNSSAIASNKIYFEHSYQRHTENSQFLFSSFRWHRVPGFELKKLKTWNPVSSTTARTFRRKLCHTRLLSFGRQVHISRVDLIESSRRKLTLFRKHRA